MKSWQLLAGCTPYKSTLAADFDGAKVGKIPGDFQIVVIFLPKKGNKKTRNPLIQRAPGSGADSQIRTGDLILTKDALYRLSYISTLSFDNERILS